MIEFQKYALAAGICLITSLARAADNPPEAGIASANKLATAAGIEVLKAGGNAFDAAVAVSAALSVVEPESSGLGGGAFALLHIANSNRDVFVDARERAPLSATRNMYLSPAGEPQREHSVNGPKAAAIPGLAAGWTHVAKKYGRLPIKTTLGPAIRLAQKGFPWGDKNAAMQGFRVEVLKRYPASSAQFLQQGAALQKGQVVKQPDLAKTLTHIVQHGHAGFYQGALAKLLVDGVNAAGGSWQLQDLSSYQIVEREPLKFKFGNYQLVTSPPPSSGGVALAQIFQMLDGFKLQEKTRVQQVHLLVEAMRRAFRDRAIYLGDPDHVEIPMDMLTSPLYAAGLRASINPEKATPSDLLPGIAMQSSSVDTTHFSIIDKDGNLVAWTQTVNLPFGNGFIAPGTGFLLNNEMDDFSVKAGTPNAFGLVGDDANAIAPGKRPLSSMTPTFLISDERVGVIGTPGGSRIITMVLGGLLRLMQGDSAEQAVTAPRLHHQYLPDAISLEPGALSEEEMQQLRTRGFTVSPSERPWGNMQIVLWDKKTKQISVGSDPRWKTVGGGGIYR